MEKKWYSLFNKLNQFIGYKSINPLKKCGMSDVFPFAVAWFLFGKMHKKSRIAPASIINSINFINELNGYFGIP